MRGRLTAIWISTGALATLTAIVVVSVLVYLPSYTTESVEVGVNTTFDNWGQLVLADYDYISPDINLKTFPSPCLSSMPGSMIFIDDTEEVVLLAFRKAIGADSAIAVMRKNHMRPAVLCELLALGDRYPEKQFNYSIIALGSEHANDRGVKLVPYLVASTRSGWRWRVLDLVERGGSWQSPTRFLAVRE